MWFLRPYEFRLSTFFQIPVVPFLIFAILLSYRRSMVRRSGHNYVYTYMCFLIPFPIFTN